MKLTYLRSGISCTTSPLSSAPRPSPPAAQCSTVPPAKWPPQRERHFARQRQSIALPQLDGGVGSHDPLPVGGVQMDGNAAEGAAPFHHRGVVMRVGDRDAGKPAEPLHDLDGGGIDERDAVPQNIAFGRAQDEPAL